jgi:hypothetical protein
MSICSATPSSDGSPDLYIVAWRLAHHERRYDEAKAIIEDLLEQAGRGVRPLPFLKKCAEWLLMDIAIHRHQATANGCFKQAGQPKATGKIPFFDEKIDFPEDHTEA